MDVKINASSFERESYIQVRTYVTSRSATRVIEVPGNAGCFVIRGCDLKHLGFEELLVGSDWLGDEKYLDLLRL